MSLYRVLVASPIRQYPDILKEYGISLMNLKTVSFQVDFLFIDDNISEESHAILIKLTQVLNGSLIKADEAAIDHNTYVRHQWDGHTISKVGNYRNRLLDFARNNEYDWLFFVDSDLLLHPETLRHLIEQGKDIISEIYWSDWSYSGALRPQVWLYDNYTQFEINRQSPLNPYQIRERTKAFYDMLRRPGIYKVGGLGGCTLISKKVLLSNVNYSPIYNLSFAGEDRHFCVRAAVNGFELYVDTAYPAYHIYRDSDLNGCKGFKERCSYKKVSYI